MSKQLYDLEEIRFALRSLRGCEGPLEEAEYLLCDALYALGASDIVEAYLDVKDGGKQEPCQAVDW